MPAHPADAESLRDVHASTWAFTYRDSVPGAFYRAALAEHRARDWAEVIRSQTAIGGGVLSAREGGLVVGLCQYGPTEDQDDDPASVGHIHRLYVAPLRQRTGAGRALLTAAVERLRRAGMSTATLWALEGDERARSFYEGLGWTHDGRRKAEPIADLRYRMALF